MSAGQDLIFFNNSEDWRVVADVTRIAEQVGENSYVPIPPIDLGVSLKCPYIAAVATTGSGKPSWQFAGDIRQVYNFVPGGSSSITGVVQSPPIRLFINKLQVVETTRISTDNFRLRYTPPFWFKDCAIRIYEYTGDALNFVEDSLFDIGNALGIDDNRPEGKIVEAILANKLSFDSQFAEVLEQLNGTDVASNQAQLQLIEQINQLDAGIFTLAEGLADLLPPDRGREIRQDTQRRLNLDLGFL